MNRHLLLLIAVLFLLLSWLINFRHYLLTWIAHHRSKPSVAKRKRKNKSRPCPFPSNADYSLFKAKKMQEFCFSSNDFGRSWDTYGTRGRE